jgi:uncharacterized protein YerC
VDGKKKDIADQNQVTSAIRLQVNKVILETYKFRRIDLGTGPGYYAVTRLKRGKKDHEKRARTVENLAKHLFFKIK